MRKLLSITAFGLSLITSLCLAENIYCPAEFYCINNKCIATPYYSGFEFHYTQTLIPINGSIYFVYADTHKLGRAMCSYYGNDGYFWAFLATDHYLPPNLSAPGNKWVDQGRLGYVCPDYTHTKKDSSECPFQAVN